MGDPFALEAGIRQGDPLSLMLFVFATSFLIRRIHAAGLDLKQFWYVDDSMIDIPTSGAVLRNVVKLFEDFGVVSNLRCSALKSELLALEQPPDTRIQGIQVVHKMKFLGVLGGDVQEGEGFEESMNKIRFKCKKIGSLALTLGVKIQQVHQWVYPTLYNVATVVPVPKKVLVLLQKYVRLALNVTTLTVSLVGLGKSLAAVAGSLLARSCIADGRMCSHWPEAWRGRVRRRKIGTYDQHCDDPARRKESWSLRWPYSTYCWHRVRRDPKVCWYDLCGTTQRCGR